jgi:hypothetical protein
LNIVKTRTKKSSAIFLIIVFFAGTFALSLSPSFIIGKAQGEAKYGSKYYNSEYYPPAYESNEYPPKDPPPDIIVPIDFPRIQEAINEANEGDVIKVLPGTYTEQLNIAKSLTIIGSGAKATIIEAPLSL